MLGVSELDALLQLGSQESGIEVENHLSLPAVHDSSDADQDTVGCQCTLSDHVYIDTGDVLIYRERHLYTFVTKAWPHYSKKSGVFLNSKWFIPNLFK